MDEQERRNIDELITRYEYEPEIRDIYVEGPSDKAFITWFLSESGAVKVDVYEIEVVDIPPEILDNLLVRILPRPGWRFQRLPLVGSACPK